MTDAEKVKYLLKKYSCGYISAKTLIREHPELDLDSKEAHMFISYYEWLRSFLDGDRSLDTFIKKIWSKK